MSKAPLNLVEQLLNGPAAAPRSWTLNADQSRVFAAIEATYQLAQERHADQLNCFFGGAGIPADVPLKVEPEPDGTFTLREFTDG